MVAGIPFNSLTDLRLARVSEKPFTTFDLAGVTKVARLLADCLEDYSKPCKAGPAPVITSFDSAWHRLHTPRMGAAL